MHSKYLLVVLGPTAIGKTSLAVDLARHFNTEIISADSRQFFKEISIGTAVPSRAELEAAKHHFIQHISVEENYSVGDFERDALARLKDIFAEKDVAVLVGGSGLYVDAVVKGLDDFPEVDKDIRKELNRRLHSEGIEILQEELKARDPVYFRQADIMNPHRLVRALEICIGTGKPYSSFRSQKNAKRSFKSILVGLTAEREIIYDRINRRVDIMLEQGLLQEAQALYPRRHLNALNTVGYKELFRHFEGELTLEEAVEEIKKNTRRFAKRQLTWFRKNPDINWFDYSTSSGEIAQFAAKKMNS